MNENTLVHRAQEERSKIFERYEKGRSDDNEIDPWEDPTFEIYHQTDEYVECNTFKLRMSSVEFVV